jgi:hypothetical protein
MVTEALTMSLSSKREYLAKIHGRYQRAGRPHKSRILDEFCLNCGYHREAALRLLHRPLGGLVRKRSGPKIIYDPAVLLPVLKPVWLASDQLCSKLLKSALPEWLAHHERRTAPLPEAFKKKLLTISPAQLDRLRQPVRVRYPRKGLSASRHDYITLPDKIESWCFGPDGKSLLTSKFDDLARWTGTDFQEKAPLKKFRRDEKFGPDFYS